MSLKLNLQKLELPNLNLDENQSKNKQTTANSKHHNIVKLNNSTNIIFNENEKPIKLNYEDLAEESLLGSGEFGIVKKMIHKPSGNKFAVKFIRCNFANPDYNNPPSSSSHSDRKAKRQKTSEIMDLEVLKRAGNGCPFLIRFYGALYIDSNILIVTELMDTSIELFCLKSIKLKLKLPESFMALTAYSVLSGLSYMKKLKLIHRDVKPSNILVNSNGEIKLCDFGISGITIDSICNSYKGCQKYMAPEKIRLTENGYSIKSDLWSLGISLIEIATGIHPYSSARGIFILSAMILEQESPKLDPKLFSNWFCSFVDKCLIKDVEKRSNIDQLLAENFIMDSLKKENMNLVLALIKLVISDA